MYRRLLFLAVTVFTFLAQIGIVSACVSNGHQPKVPESLIK